MAPFIHETPLLHIELQAAKLDAKLENLQNSGSFKIRGAANAVSSAATAGFSAVVCWSSGNHGAAVATVARRLGLACMVVAPKVAPQEKLDRITALGAQIELVDYAHQRDRATEISRLQGAFLVPPFDHRLVIAGQATLGLELAERLSGDSVLYLPVGGGGLISGVARALHLTRPDVAVVGVEPELAADAHQSFTTKKRVAWNSLLTVRTVADGVRSEAVGELNFAHILEHVTDLIVVSDAAILAGAHLAQQATRSLVEPTAGLGPAGFLQHHHSAFPGRPGAVVLTGSNARLP